MKKIVFLFFLTLSQANAQWEYKVNNTEKTIEAIGGLEFKTQFQDTIILNLSKSRKLGLDFSIQGEYFKSGEKYYVLFEISDRKIKVLRSINERNRFRIFEVKDLISKERYELEDFLKILKKGEECVLTIRSILELFKDIINSQEVERQSIMFLSQVSPKTFSYNLILHYRITTKCITISRDNCLKGPLMMERFLSQKQN